MIVSRANRTIKDIRRLQRCKGDHAILEGPHLVAEALALGLPLTSVLLTPEMAATEEGRTLARRLPRAPLLVATEVLAECSDADSPQGVLAVADLPRSQGALPMTVDSVALFLDRVQDPGNLGALARVAEATGATGLLLSPGCAHPNHPRALRASAGSLLRLPVATGVEVESPSRRAAATPTWIGLDPHQGEDLWSAPLDPPLVLAVGGEGPGLSPATRARVERLLRIPLAAPVESLNVAVAVALVLFERRRRAAAALAGPASRRATRP